MKSGVLVLQDYLSLAKPRVILLHLITATTAMFLAARGMPAGSTLLFTLLGGGLVAAGANALNCYLDRDLDKNMPRTRERPLPAGRLAPSHALIFGLACAALGLFLLAWMINWVTAALALAALAFYVLVYTLWLKRRTYMSSILSSGVGAMPPLIGWVAVTGRLEVTPWLLFGVIALWTPPHFWALASMRRDEYERAGLTVLPRERPVLWISVFAVLLLLLTIVLAGVARMGYFYAVPAAILGSGFIYLSLRLQPQAGSQPARRLYLYSIFYLVALFALMLLDCTTLT